MRAKFFIFFMFSIASIFSEARTLLVTGGAGFIGSNFVNYMYDTHPEYRIIILDKLTYCASLDKIREDIKESDRFFFYKGDICDPVLVDTLMKQSNLVVHFAAESDVTRSIRDDEVFFRSNVMGTRNLLTSLVRYKDSIERFINISSSEVYGTCKKEHIDEEHLLEPMSPYAAAKAGADRMVYAYGCTYNVPVTTLRFFNNYGPNQHIEKLIGKFIVLALNGKQLTVHGDGGQVRDWIHTTDTARAIDAALHVEPYDTIRNEVINCGTGVATSVKDIADVINDYFGFSDNIRYVSDRPGQVQMHLSSTEKARRLLNWQSSIGFEEGLIDVIEWYTKKEGMADKILDRDAFISNDVLIHEKEG